MLSKLKMQLKMNIKCMSLYSLIIIITQIRFKLFFYFFLPSTIRIGHRPPPADILIIGDSDVRHIPPA